MTPRATSWDGSIVIERGPLVYALPIGEDWRAVGGHPDFPDFEVHPTTAWNYGLQVDPAAPQPSIGVETSPPASQPWTQDGSGLALRIPAKRIPQWSAVNGMSGPVPRPLVRSTEPTDEITLIPYGCARLRISMFPRVD
jgi:hypothetical protein